MPVTIELTEVPSSGLWSSLPREIAARYRPHAGRIIAEVFDEVRRNVPEFGGPPDSRVTQDLRESIEHLVKHCVDTIGNPRAERSEWAELIRLRGVQEFRSGRTMDALQTAYRVGGRAAWRAVSRIGLSIGIPANMLAVGAEAIFAFVNDISRLSLEGYAAEQARAAGTMARRRQRLMELILQQPAVSPHEITSLANATGWPVPARLTVVALAPPDRHDLSASTFHQDVLADTEGGRPSLITADPEAHLCDIEFELPGWRAVVGPEVAFTEAAMSLRWATRGLDLLRRGIITDKPVVWCREHLATLWLLADEPLVGELARRSLAPLADLTASQRTRLGETLLAWLETRGSAPEIAKVLAVHPQTVRYRMHQLESLFGDRLNDPDERLAMELALRAQRLLAQQE